MKTQRWMARVGMVLGIAGFGLAAPMQGQECPELVGEQDVGFWFYPARIEVSGSLVFLGGPHIGPTGGCKGGGPSPMPVEIIDVSDPENPRVLGVVSNLVTDFSASEDRLYILSSHCRETLHYETVTVVGVANREQPHRLGYFSGGGHPSWSYIEAVGDTVFLATSDGLSVLDATDPSNPNELGTLEIPWEPSGLFAEGELLYVAEPDSGLRIIDVADPTNVVVADSRRGARRAGNFEVLDGLAYVADGAGGLRVIDATNPSMPTELSTLHTAAEASQVSVAGSYAIILLSDGNVLLVDVSDPGNPEKVGVFAGEGPALAAALSGTTAYISEGDSDSFPDGRFQVVNLEHPGAPVESAFFGYRLTAMDVAVEEGVQYIASGYGGLFTVDLTVDHLNPYAIHDFLDTPGFALGVTLHGDLAFVADGPKGLRIIDVSDSANIVEVGFADTPGQAHQVAVAGDYAYVADGEGGLRIIDISVPESPVEVGAVATPDPAVDVAVEGEFAYVADGHLRVIDVTDPTNPFDDTPEDARESTTVGIEDRTLYSASGDHLEIFDLSGYSVPGFIASIGFMGSARDVAFSGQHAYVATQLDDESETIGVEIVDILNPNFPTWIGSWSGTGGDPVVAASYGRIYLATGGSEIGILDSRCLTTYWVQIVAHNDGLHDSHWRSDVIVIHEQERSVNVAFVLHTADGEFTAEASVDVGRQGVFKDIVGILGYEGKGALEIQADLPITVISRAYSETEFGTFGTFFMGHRASECIRKGTEVRLLALRQEAGKFRTNINVTNTGEELGIVDITLYRTDGRELVSYWVEVEPGMVVQDLQPFKNRANEPNVGWGFATVRVVNPGATMLVSATVIDSRTNDPAMVTMVR